MINGKRIVAASDMDVVPSTTKKRKVCDGDVRLSPSLLHLTENYASTGSSTSSCSLDLDNENGVEEAAGKSSNKSEAESGELESTRMPEMENSPPRRVPEKKPSRDEIEEFFARREKEMFERFREKYNFDFEKEEPLKGRYEWVKI